ncbi:MAG: hypothetical protein Q9160_004595 [Pyrenula sp. 1 TL-2023]
MAPKALIVAALAAVLAPVKVRAQHGAAGPTSASTSKPAGATTTAGGATTLSTSTRAGSPTTTRASGTTTAASGTTAAADPGNLFANHQIYANPYYSSEIFTSAIPSLPASLAAKASGVAKVGTFTWL